MATPLTDLTRMLDREVNTPGVEMLPDLGTADLLGYIEDGFWDARLAGLLSSYTVVDAADVDQATPPTAGRYFVDSATSKQDLPVHFQMLVVIVAGVRLLRNKVLNLAINFKAEAGPVSYEQQASATTLRSILATLQSRYMELKTQYSDTIGASAMVYMDGVLQAETAVLNDLAALTVIP
jgi:hypothetical protein